ncbi:MAG TPA: hypothetical protein PKX92_07520 [Edaphocola sp.]|nr:hypothetical protein [Edaphocola sp.]
MKESIIDIYNRCKAILNYLKSQSQDSKSDFLFVDFEQILDTTYKSNNTKGIAMLKRDLEAWSKSLPKEKQNELNALLKGGNIYHEQELLLSKILKQGQIDSREDYVLIVEILKDLNEQDKYYKDIEALEQMVANYDFH